MQLSRFTDYSIRVLAYAALNSDRLVTLSELSQYYDISLEHLRKVVHSLAKNGYLKTYRGKKGGMELSCEPESINIGDVIKTTEGYAPLLDCSGMACKILPLCKLPAAINKAQEAFFAELSRYTLADVLSQNSDSSNS